MVLFMFIAISYIIEVKSQAEEVENVITDFKTTTYNLYMELDAEFKEDFQNDKWNAVLDKDLSIRFLNEEVQFDYDKAEIKPEFTEILKNFFPRYLKILMKDEYKDKIAEVRIEGHTDPRGGYIYNVQLSQARTRNVLDFLLNNNGSIYEDLSDSDRKILRFWLTANGLSYGRTLDSNSQYTINSSEPVSNTLSRRVEFRIVTTSESLLNNLYEEVIQK